MRRILLLLPLLCALGCVSVAQAATKEITIKGRLTPTVEAGGWLVVTAKEKYLLLNAARWRVMLASAPLPFSAYPCLYS